MVSDNDKRRRHSSPVATPTWYNVCFQSSIAITEKLVKDNERMNKPAKDKDNTFTLVLLNATRTET